MSNAVSTTGILIKRKPLTVPVAVTSSSAAAASLITTGAPHGLSTGDSVTISGHTGSTPAITGPYVITVVSPTTFTIPLTVSVAGTGGAATTGYRTVAEIRVVGPGGKSRNEIDSSIHNEGTESKVLGMLRQKNPTLKINVVGNEPTHQTLNDDIDNNVKANWQIVFPSGITRTGDARVQQFEYDDAPMDGLQGATLAFSWAGVVTEAFA